MLQLTIKERVMLSDILPQQGNKLQQIVVRGILKKVEFTTDEIETFGVTFNSQGISWNEIGKNSIFEITLNDSEISVLKESTNLLDKQSKITQFNLNLVEKIDLL